MDIAISDGAIAAIQPEIGDSEASRVLEVRGSNRYVVPGLIDVHTHVAYGATTPGVGIGCVDPDVGGVGSGVTTVLDAGSVGIANVGVFGAYLRWPSPGPRSRRRTNTLLAEDADRGGHSHPPVHPESRGSDGRARSGPIRCARTRGSAREWRADRLCVGAWQLRHRSGPSP